MESKMEQEVCFRGSDFCSPHQQCLGCIHNHQFGCESWTVKKADRKKIDSFEMWCWRRVLRIPCTAKKTNKGVLDQFKPEICLEATGCEARWIKKCVSVALIFAVLVSSALVAFVTIRILTKSSSGPCPATTVSSCPSKWVGYEGKCYYFSEVEGNWAFSQSNCSASDASLVAIENQEEMKFIMKHKEPTDYWIGLKREERQPWKWADGSIFNSWFEIGADGFCAFLDDDMARSTWCTTERNWICSKSLYTT